jgi:hypothetical protein
MYVFNCDICFLVFLNELLIIIISWVIIQCFECVSCPIFGIRFVIKLCSNFPLRIGKHHMMRVYDRKSHLYGLCNLESIELNDMFGAFNLVVLWKHNPKRRKT